MTLIYPPPQQNLEIVEGQENKWQKGGSGGGGDLPRGLWRNQLDILTNFTQTQHMCCHRQTSPTFETFRRGGGCIYASISAFICNFELVRRVTEDGIIWIIRNHPIYLVCSVCRHKDSKAAGYILEQISVMSVLWDFFHCFVSIL